MNEEILKRLDVLAAKLGVTAQYLWGVLIKEARIELVEDVMFVLLVIALAYGYYKWFPRIKSAWDRCENMPEGVGGLFGGIGLFILVVIAVLCIFEIPQLALNPEYWALKQVIGAVK